MKLILSFLLFYNSIALACNNQIENLLVQTNIKDEYIKEVDVLYNDKFLYYAAGNSRNVKSIVMIRIADGYEVRRIELDKFIPIKKLKSISLIDETPVLLSTKGKVLKKLKSLKIKIINRDPVSYSEVLSIMEKGKYESELPITPITLFKFVAGKLKDSFFGLKRSNEILSQGLDYRLKGQVKPIHPNGVGMEGKVVFTNTKYSGLFSGSEFPALARFSISQENPHKKVKKSLFRKIFNLPEKDQARSVSLALKVFPTNDKNKKVVTANAVFQNDLNGEVLVDANGNKTNNFLDGVLTNQPRLDVRKIRKPYEVFTLIAVAISALKNPNDRLKKLPIINPQIRPLHQLGESQVISPSEVNTPIWMKIQVDSDERFDISDFREEINPENFSDGRLKYKVFLANEIDSNENIIWEEAGHLEFHRAIYSEGVDQNILFHHSSLTSDFTGITMEAPTVPVPERSN